MYTPQGELRQEAEVPLINNYTYQIKILSPLNQVLLSA